MKIVRDGNDYEPQIITRWRLRELMQCEKDNEELLALRAQLEDARMRLEGMRISHERWKQAHTALCAALRAYRGTLHRLQRPAFDKAFGEWLALHGGTPPAEK